MKVLQTTIQPYEPQPCQKLQQTFFKSQKTKYRSIITKLIIDETTYYMIYASKKETILSEQCQLIALCDKDDKCFLGYALESDGFPYVPNKKPLFKQVKSFFDIIEMDSKSGKLIINTIGQEQPWKFKFVNVGLADQWLELLTIMREERQKKQNGKSKKRKQSEQIEQAFGLSDLPETSEEQIDKLKEDVQEWRGDYETLEKQCDDLRAIVVQKDEKITSLEADLEKERKNIVLTNVKYEQKISKLEKDIEQLRTKSTGEKKNPNEIVDKLKKTLEQSYEASSKLKIENKELKKKIIKGESILSSGSNNKSKNVEKGSQNID